MLRIGYALLACVVLGTGLVHADSLSIVNGDFESGLDGWTVVGNGTLWFNDYNNPTHFFGYSGSCGDTTISQVIGDGETRFDGTYEGAMVRNTWGNKLKAGLRYWMEPDMSDEPEVIWFAWDEGDYTNQWHEYDAGPIASGDLEAEPYWIEVRVRLCELDAGGDCHNFIDDLEFEANLVPEAGALSLGGMLLGAAGLVLRRK